MKKLFGYVLLIALLAGCQKSEPVPLKEYSAQLELAGNPAADGLSVDQLVLDSTREILIPINKKGDWPKTQPQGPTPVAIRFVDTGKTIPVSGQTGQIFYLRLVYVVTFRQI